MGRAPIMFLEKIGTEDAKFEHPSLDTVGMWARYLMSIVTDVGDYGNGTWGSYTGFAGCVNLQMAASGLVINLSGFASDIGGSDDPEFMISVSVYRFTTGDVTFNLPVVSYVSEGFRAMQGIAKTESFNYDVEVTLGNENIKPGDYAIIQLLIREPAGRSTYHVEFAQPVAKLKV